MKRKIDINEISDGKLYDLNDMVKADCNGCVGCSACCRNMGQSIILDPFDIYRLTTNLHITMEQLLSRAVELNVVDGIILPNIAMSSDKNQCSFLDENGRCSIHEFRPGICRLFPLGRFYENGDYRYFLQIYECKNPNRSKIKVKKYIGEPDWKQNRLFVNQWHDFLIEIQEQLLDKNDEIVKKVDVFLLQHFYMEPYGNGDFYAQFAERMKSGKEIINKLMN